MFKIEKKATFFWPVLVNVPKDGGGFASHEFQAEFKFHEQSKMDLLLERLKNDDHDILRDLLVGWKQVSNPDGTPVEYTEEAKEALIDIPYVRSALLKSYFEAISGNKVKRGN
jgi:hypothetical protein